MAVDALGNAYVAGWSLGVNGDDYRVVKLAAGDGSVLWDVAYDGGAHGTDKAYALALDTAGDAFVVGSEPQTSTLARVTLKLASVDGSLAWTAALGGISADGVAAVTTLPGGDVAVASASLSNNGRSGFRTIKYSGTSGAELFSVSDGTVAGIRDLPALGVSLAVDEAGAVVVAGTSDPFLSVMSAVKYEPDGSVAWATTYDSPDQQGAKAFALALDGEGNAFVTGASAGALTPDDFRTVKLAAADGSVLWTAAHDGPGHLGDVAVAIAVGATGDAYVTGVEQGVASQDWRTIRYSGVDGTVVWSVAYDSGGFDQPLRLALDAGGNAYVLGTKGGVSGDGTRLTKCAAGDGSALWSQDLVGVTPGAVALDNLGNASIVGTLPNGSDDDLVIARYASSDGTLLWSRTYDGPTHGDDVAVGISVDAAGDAYVVGDSLDDVARTTRVNKYAAADGSLLWSVPVPGVVAEALALDAAGDPYVGGVSEVGNPLTLDFATARLAGSDGHLLWRVTLDGAHNQEDLRTLVARGAAVYATGSSFAPRTGLDLLTVKYVPDSLPPQPPSTAWSPSHPTAGWSNHTAIAARWSGAIDPPPASGLLGYSVAFDGSAGTIPDATVDVPHSADPHGTTSAALPEGQGYYFHVRACDHGGNCSPAVHAGPYAIDTTAPLAPASVTSSSHVPGVPSSVTMLALQWTAAVDPLSNGVASGIDGYGWSIDDEAATGCSNLKTGEEWTTSVSLPLGPGTWYAHVCARDNAGNWSGVTTAGPYLIGDPADLSLTLTDDADPVHTNGMVAYTATYGNAGPSSAPNATLDLTLPAGLGFVSSVPGEPACTGSDQSVKCGLGDLGSSTGGTVTVTAQVLRWTKGLQTVGAKVRAEASDTDLSNNVASQTTLVKFVKGDLQDDWATDLFLRNVTTGENVAWLMDGTTRLSEAPIDPAVPDFSTQQVSGVDDFDGDGRNDLVFWDSLTGAVEFWPMDGAMRSGDPVPLTGGSQPPPWRLAATADFDRDGRPDLLWRNEVTQKLVVWTLHGTAKTGEIVPGPDQAAHANWQVVGAVDLNGDGNVDLLWYNVDTGKIVYWWMDGSVQRITGSFTNPASAGNSNWKVLATGDYGVGTGGVPETADLVWRNETSGKYVVWHLDLAGNRTSGTFTTPDAPTSPLDWTLVGPR